jgi:hypothetical protein
MAAPFRSSAAGADDEELKLPVQDLHANREDHTVQSSSALALEGDAESSLLPEQPEATFDADSASLSILALQHRVALLKARTLQHQQLIAEMRRREQELEVSILRRQLAQLREQVSDRADQLSQLRHRCRLVSELALSVNRVMETRSALASGNPHTLPNNPHALPKRRCLNVTRSSAQRVLLSAQQVAAQMRALGDGDVAAADEDSGLLGAAAAAALIAVRQQTDAVSGTIQSLREGQFASTLMESPLEDEAPCIICQELMAVGDGACALPCRHSFHPRCLSRWLSFRPVCPLCMLVVDV